MTKAYHKSSKQHHQDNKSSNPRMTKEKGYNFKEYDAGLIKKLTSYMTT